LTVKGLTIMNSGGSGVKADDEPYYGSRGAEGSRWNQVSMKNIKFIGYEIRAPYIIDESSVSKTGQDAIVCWSGGKAVVESSRFTDIGTALGMRKSSAAIMQNSFYPTGSVIRNNYIARTSYIGTFSGNGATVEGNTIENACLIFDDCAGIYSWGYNSGHSVLNNIVRHVTSSAGSQVGKPTATRGAYPVCGIYLDDQSYSMDVENNFISDVDFGIFVHNSRNSLFKNNEIVGFSNAGVYLAGGEERREWYVDVDGSMQQHEFEDPAMVNNNFEGNIIADTQFKPMLRLTLYGWGSLKTAYLGNGNYYWNFFSPTILNSDIGGTVQNYNYANFQSMEIDSNPVHPVAGPFSDAPERHVQGLANIDYYATTSFPCPSGASCTGWVDASQAQVSFPVTLGPRESKILWHP
jgi:parallel beta-helix repeat protein